VCCSWLAGNTGRKNWPSAHHHTILLGCIFAIKSYIDNWKKKLLKQQYLLHMPSQYGELPPTNGRDRLTGLVHPSKFERGSCLGFGTATTSLSRSSTNFARYLAVCWAGVLYVHFRGLLPQRNSARCKIHFTTNFNGFHVLAALLHGTLVVGVSQTLRH